MSQYGDELSTTYRDMEEDHHAEWMDSEDEEYNEEYDEDNISIGNLVDDIAAIDVKYGRDIQGIPWEERLYDSRELNRLTRLQRYVDIQDIPNSITDSLKVCNWEAHQQRGQAYYEFQYNTRSINMDIPHFQLRNLVWATTKHDVYLMGYRSVLHWSALTFEKREVIDLLGRVLPSEEHYRNVEEGFFKPKVCTMAVKDNLLIGGGMKGEIICKFLDREGISYCCKSTPIAEGRTNAVEIFENPSGSVHFLAASNDRQARDFDMETFTVCNNLSFPWIAHHASVSPDRKLALLVGESTDGLVVDASSGQTVHTLRGHFDFCFASAWNPDNQTFATGSQDRTCRVWDIRNLSKSVAVLRGNMAAIRCIRYTSDGKFMAISETADFLHIFDVESGYTTRQEVDFFGEVSGISFSPDTEALFVGLSDANNNSLIEFRRHRGFSYLDTVL